MRFLPNLIPAVFYAAIQLGLGHSVYGKTAVAEFYNDGVQGFIEFNQDNLTDSVSIKFALNGLNEEAGGFHIHTNPVTLGGSSFVKNSVLDGCSNEIVGGHFNPLLVVGGAGNPGLYECSPTEQSKCEAGDLAGKFGSLKGLNELNLEVVDGESGLTLFGEDSIIGRSVVIHRDVDGSRWVCATVVEKDVVYRKVTATLDGENVFGSITFLQDEQDSNAETVIVASLWSNEESVGAGHGWHVHESRMIGDDLYARNCAATGGHFNPLGADGSACNATSVEGQVGCGVGELAAKHGALTLTASKKTWVFSDPNLPLSGDLSIVGRAIVIHGADGAANRIACANLGKTVVATFEDFDVVDDSVYPNGTITFFHGADGDPVEVSVDLAGLNSLAGGYHVHVLPLFDIDAVADVSSCGATAGHFNPLGAPVVNCSAETPENCEAGDLAGRHGSLAGLDELKLTYFDEGAGLTLFGPNSIVGRSIVIHKADGSRWACANIVSNELQVTKQEAIFSDETKLVGMIRMTQNTYEPSDETSVFVALQYGTESSVNESLGHKWHVHQDQINETCASTGGHFNPMGIIGGAGVTGTYLCSSSDRSMCEVGDLANKLGALNIAPGFRWFGTEVELPLNGYASVSNRSVVVHVENGGGDRFDCADLEDVKFVQEYETEAPTIAPTSNTTEEEGDSAVSVTATSTAAFFTLAGLLVIV